MIRTRRHREDRLRAAGQAAAPPPAESIEAVDRGRRDVLRGWGLDETPAA